MKVALLLNKAGAYDRGLFKGIISFPFVGPTWSFFYEAPYFVTKELYKDFYSKLKNWEPDCIIANQCYNSPKLKELGVPLIVTPEYQLVDGVINIMADDKEIGKEGAKYFVEKGFKNLAFYGTDKIYWSKARKSAFKEMVISSNLNYFELDALLNKEWYRNPARVKEFLESLPKPVGIMACQDEFGIQVIQQAKLAGFRVPEDVSVLGVDNDFFLCDLEKPPMSSIDQRTKEIGFEVAMHLERHFLENKKLPNVFKGKKFRVVARQSTDVFAVEDAELKKALRFIRINAEKRCISVNEVVGATCLSRRPLELRFRSVLDRSILQEIRRVRINKACVLLLETTLSVSEIAYLMDFNSHASFSSIFKQETTYTSSEYRKLYQNDFSLIQA